MERMFAIRRSPFANRYSPFAWVRVRLAPLGEELWSFGVEELWRKRSVLPRPRRMGPFLIT